MGEGARVQGRSHSPHIVTNCEVQALKSNLRLSTTRWQSRQVTHTGVPASTGVHTPNLHGVPFLPKPENGHNPGGHLMAWASYQSRGAQNRGASIKPKAAMMMMSSCVYWTPTVCWARCYLIRSTQLEWQLSLPSLHLQLCKEDKSKKWVETQQEILKELSILNEETRWKWITTTEDVIRP